MGFLQRDIREIEYAGSVSPNLSHCIVGVFHGITRLEPSFFPLGFWRIIHVNWASIVQEGVDNKIPTYLIIRCTMEAQI
jgi:hypothetical protein